MRFNLVSDKEFDLVGIINIIKGNEDKLICCKPIIRTDKNEYYFALRNDWVEDPTLCLDNKTFPDNLHKIYKEQITEAGSIINPPRKIKNLQIVAQVGPVFFASVNALNKDLTDKLFDGFFEIENGFRCKVFYNSAFDQFQLYIIDLACVAFDREIKRVILSENAICALEIFTNIIPRKNTRWKVMALRMYCASIIDPESYYKDMAFLFAERAGYYVKTSTHFEAELEFDDYIYSIRLRFENGVIYDPLQIAVGNGCA